MYLSDISQHILIGCVMYYGVFQYIFFDSGSVIAMANYPKKKEKKK